MRLILNIIFGGVMTVLALLIHHDVLFHFSVVSDEYKYKGLVKTTFKFCGKPIFLEIYHTCNISARLHYFSKMRQVQSASIDRRRYYLGPVVEIL